MVIATTCCVTFVSISWFVTAQFFFFTAGHRWWLPDEEFHRVIIFVVIRQLRNYKHIILFYDSHVVVEDLSKCPYLFRYIRGTSKENYHHTLYEYYVLYNFISTLCHCSKKKEISRFPALALNQIQPDTERWQQIISPECLAVPYYGVIVKGAGQGVKHAEQKREMPTNVWSENLKLPWRPSHKFDDGF